MRAQLTLTAASGAVVVGREIAAPIHESVAPLAEDLIKFAMHVNEIAAAGPLVQVVDVLGHDDDFARPFALELGQGKVGGVGGDARVGQSAAPGVVELVNQVGVADEGFRRGDVLEADARPDPVGAAKGVEPGLLRNAGAGEDDDVAIGGVFV